MSYNPQIHHRKSIRLKGYDYSQAGLYFITLCCRDREHLFGYIKNGEMILNKYGEIALTEWYHTEQIRENCRIYESIIMPNHIHGIIEITQKKGEEGEIGKFESSSQTIGSIIRGFKIASIKRIKDLIQNSELEFSTGELQFAPTEFAPTEFAPTEFAPTEFAPTEFAPTPTEIIKSLDFKIWQGNYFERIIRNEQSFQKISDYIINNPQKWENDKSKKNEHI